MWLDNLFVKLKRRIYNEINENIQLIRFINILQDVIARETKNVAKISHKKLIIFRNFIERPFS